MWTEVNKGLPKVLYTVLLCTNKHSVCSGYLSKRKDLLWVLHDPEIQNEEVVAWQPLPIALNVSECVSVFDIKHKKENDKEEDFMNLWRLCGVFLKTLESQQKLIDSIQQDIINLKNQSL